MFDLFLKFLEAHLGLSPAFIAILDPVLKSAGNTLLADATVAAQPIVADLEKGTLPTSEKADAAVKQLTADFQAEGKSLLPSVAHLAVELALQKVRSAI